jgi:hypothetical protein
MSAFAAGPEKRAVYRTENGGLVMTVSIPTGDFIWNKDDIVIEITNTSTENFVYGEVDVMGGFRLTLVDDRNEKVKLTETGEECFRALPRRTRFVTRNLLPGASFEAKFNLSQFFKVPKAGDYRLSVVWLQTPVAGYEKYCLKLEVTNIPISIPRI